MHGHTLRQAALATLTANAIRPLDTPVTATPAFIAGWPVGELAPQLLALGAVDTLVSLARRRTSLTGLLCSAGATAGLALLTRRALQARGALDAALAETVESDEPVPEPASLRTLCRPFAMADPDVEVLRDLPYTEGGRRARLDIFRPKGVELHDAPVLVQIHGGAWMVSRKEDQGQLLMHRMAARGWVCVAVNYRLAPKHRWPTQIVDVKRSLGWVHENIADYGGSSDYVVLTGGSAGGHLSALAALTPGRREWQPGFEDADTSVAACVPFYGVYDMVGDDGDIYTQTVRDGLLAKWVFPPDTTFDDYRLASPLHWVGPDAPDFFILHGALDTLVTIRQARAFVAALRERSRATVTYAELPGAQHAFDIFGSIRGHEAARAVQRWLEWHRARWLRDHAAERPSSAG